MTRIVIAGLQKERIERCVREAGGDRVEVLVTSDMDAANRVKTGLADYYIGACNSGGGAALAMAIALLGYNRCATVKPDQQKIASLVGGGTVAFGIAEESIEFAVPLIVSAMLDSAR